jgi:hypothetical protein
MACTQWWGTVLRARKDLTVTVAYDTCTMPIWLTTTCPETLIVTLGEVLESGNAKNHVNLTCSVCARCEDEVLCGAETLFLDVRKWGRVNELKTAKSCTQVQGKWSSRSTLSPTMQKTRCGYRFLIELGFTHKFSWKCVVNECDQHSLTQLEEGNLKKKRYFQLSSA